MAAFQRVTVYAHNISGLTLFGHTKFRFNHKGKKKVDNSGGRWKMGVKGLGMNY
jgi:hypothetical protein